MSKLVWDAQGAHIYETGVDQVALYVMDTTGYGTGVAWNGVTAFNESPSGADANALYADNIKYLNLISAEEFAASIEAYTYPDEFEECDGAVEIAPGAYIGQQARKVFGLAVRTMIGNDVDGQAHGYKLHLIYGCQATPTEKGYQTVNDSPDANSMSWELNTTPVNVTGAKPTARLIVDSTKTAAGKWQDLIDVVYGVDAPEFSSSSTYAVGDYVTHTESSTAKVYKCNTAITTAGTWDASKWTEVTNPGPRLPLPDEVATILAST